MGAIRFRAMFEVLKNELRTQSATEAIDDGLYGAIELCVAALSAASVPPPPESSMSNAARHAHYLEHQVDGAVEFGIARAFLDDKTIPPYISDLLVGNDRGRSARSIGELLSLSPLLIRATTTDRCGGGRLSPRPASLGRYEPLR